MQATGTARRLSSEHLTGVALAGLLLAGLAVGAVVLDVCDRLPVIGGSEPRSVTVPQISPDEAYALEAELMRSQVNGWHTVPHMTSDEAWALEQSFLASSAGHVTDVSELNLDNSGADVFSTPEFTSPDTTRLRLDRDGADIP